MNVSEPPSTMLFQKLIVLISVKCNLFFRLNTIPILIFGLALHISQNCLELVIIGCALTGMLILMGVNSINDSVYHELWPEKANDPDKLLIMYKNNIWAVAFFMSLVFAFLTSLSVNIIDSGREVWINGERVYDFQLINPATDNVRDHGPKK